MKEKNVSVGIFFILMAVLVIVSQVADLKDVDEFSIMASIVLLWIVVDGNRRKNCFEIIFASAFLIILHLDTIGIKGLTPWGVLTAALLESIGFSFLFPRNRKKKHNMDPEQGTDCEGTACSSGPSIRCENVLGKVVYRVDSGSFSEACLENQFGEMRIYFDSAMLQDRGDVKIKNHFGWLILYIPKEWHVQMDLEQDLGSVNEHGKCLGSGRASLCLYGGTNFGNIEIYYV